MDQFLKNRSTYEATFVVFASLLFGLGLGMLGALSLRFQIALAIGMVGFLIILITPARRTLCLCLYVLIQPLSIEKILFVDEPVWTGLRGLEVVMNAGDLILMLLAAILITERLTRNKSQFVFDQKAQLLLILLVWGAISYLVHSLFYQSPYVDSAPLGLLHLLRNLLFVVIIGSAIQSKSDVIWVLLSVLAILILELQS